RHHSAPPGRESRCGGRAAIRSSRHRAAMRRGSNRAGSISRHRCGRPARPCRLPRCGRTPGRAAGARCARRRGMSPRKGSAWRPFSTGPRCRAMSGTGTVRVGISGWTYAPWRGNFYPAGLQHADELSYASRQVETIEINGTFYGLQRADAFARWYDETPQRFVFAVKGPRFMTLLRRLREVETLLAIVFYSVV